MTDIPLLDDRIDRGEVISRAGLFFADPAAIAPFSSLSVAEPPFCSLANDKTEEKDTISDERKDDTMRAMKRIGRPEKLHRLIHDVGSDLIFISTAIVEKEKIISIVFKSEENRPTFESSIMAHFVDFNPLFHANIATPCCVKPSTTP